MNGLSATKIGDLQLRNPYIKAGCFEGMSQGGGVTEELINHHRRVAAGGVGMTTVAYCSVTFDGRAFDHEMWMRPEIIPDLKKLTKAVHREGAAASIQLGHCGYFASRKVIRRRPLGASPKFNLFRLSRCKQMTRNDILEKTNDFADAARMARDAGFDAVEIHAGHGYLLSQFISPYTNHRHDDYGGPLENRMRFPVEVVMAVRQAVGKGFPILVKMNQLDGMRGGLMLEEALEVAKLFEKAGASAIIPSCGFTSKTPLFMLRGHVPVKEMVRNQKNPVSKLGLYLFGNNLVQRYPYTRLFLLEGAVKMQAVLNIPVVYIGGIKEAADVRLAHRQGMKFIQLGRTLIHDPDFVAKLNDEETENIPGCDSCNRCIAAMDAGGVYCVSKERGYLPLIE